MKKTFTLVAFFVTAFAVIKFSNLTSKPASTPDANFLATGGYTGGPTNNMTCANSGCHEGTAVIDASKFTLKMATSLGGLSGSPGIVTSATKYAPGTSYFMSFEHNSPTPDTLTRFGFSLTALSDTNQAGSFVITNLAQTKLVNGNKDMSHKAANNAIKAWVFKWNAPATPDSVTFYFAGLIANGDDTTTNDLVYYSNIGITADTSSTISINEISTISNFGVYPTQTFSDVAVNIESEINSDAKVELISLAGANIYELFSGKLNQGNNDFRFSIADFAAGAYFISVTTDGKRISRQIIKQ